MPNVPTHVARLLFDEPHSNARRAKTNNRAGRSRFDTQPRRRFPRT